MHHLVTGNACINAWDQVHAEALDKLRHADAFLLVTWPRIDGPSDGMVAIAKDGGEETMRAMLTAVMQGALGAYEELEDKDQNAPVPGAEEADRG